MNQTLWTVDSVRPIPTTPPDLLRVPCHPRRPVQSPPTRLCCDQVTSRRASSDVAATAAVLYPITAQHLGHRIFVPHPPTSISAMRRYTLSPTPSMRHLLLLCFSMLLLSLHVALISAQVGSRDLTSAEFTSVVFSKPTFVKFFSPSCGHCRALAPIWEETAKLIHREYPNVQLVGLDCTQYGEVCNKFAVRGYPTIVYIRPRAKDAELLSLSRDSPASLSALPREVYLYQGSRSVLSFEHFISDYEVWSQVTPTAYPLALPIEPIPMVLVERDQQVKAEVEGEVHGQPRMQSKAKTMDAVKAGLLKGVEGGLGGGAVGVLKKVAGILKEQAGDNSTAVVAYETAGSWVLNAALVVVLSLIVVVALFLYLTARAAIKPNKVV